MDDVEQRVARAAPPVTEGAAIEAAVARLATTTKPGQRARRWAVRLGIGAVGLGVFAGATAATALAVGWEPWLADPDLTFAFTTPSGQECLGRAAVDDTQPHSPEQVAALEAVLADPAVFDAALERVDLYVIPDPAKHPDRVYIEAVADSFSRTVGTELAARGSDEIGWGFQIQCPGAQW